MESPVGLTNIGESCFLNAFLQSMFACCWDTVKRIPEFQAIVKKIQNTKQPNVREMKEVLRVITKQNSRLANGQQDFSETMDAACSAFPSLSSPFSFEEQSILKCKICNYVRTTTTNQQLIFI